MSAKSGPWWRTGNPYEFIDDGRADSVDKVYGDLQKEHDEKEGRHLLSFAGSARAEQCSYDRNI